MCYIHSGPNRPVLLAMLFVKQIDRIFEAAGCNFLPEKGMLASDLL